MFTHHHACEALSPRYHEIVSCSSGPGDGCSGLGFCIGAPGAPRLKLLAGMLVPPILT